MDLIIQYFTVDAPLAVLVTLVMGIFIMVITFFSEVVDLYRRMLWLFSKAGREKWTWRTIMWLPVRITAVILIPQIIYIIFTRVFNFY